LYCLYLQILVILDASQKYFIVYNNLVNDEAPIF